MRSRGYSYFTLTNLSLSFGRDSNKIPTAKPTHLRSEISRRRILIYTNETGSHNSKMAASKPEVIICWLAPRREHFWTSVIQLIAADSESPPTVCY